MSKKDYMRVTPYNRSDGITSVGVEFNGDLSTMNLEIGTKLEMTVVGVERREWEGIKVQ